MLGTTGSVLLFLALAASPLATATDIIAQIKKMGLSVKALTELPTLADYPRLADRVTDDAAFAELPAGLQRAVLWDLGLIRLAGSDSDYTQIYVRCPRSMNDIFLTAVSFDEDACPVNADGCKHGVQAYAKSTCNATEVVKRANCAVADDSDALSLTEWSNATMWSMEAKDLDDYDPQLFAHDLNAMDGKAPMVYLIAQYELPKLGQLGDAGCLVSSTFVVPCRKIQQSEVDKSESIWCTPAPLLSLYYWQLSVNSSLLASDASSSGNSNGSSGVSTAVAVALGVVAGVLAVLVVAFLVLWLRAKRRARSGSMSHYVESMQPGLVSTHPNNNSSTRPSGQMTGSSTGHASTGARPSMTAAQMDAINDKYRQRSPVLQTFCSDQELMLKHISFSGLVFRQKIASGANGEVWQGEHDGQVVAIKRVMPSSGNSKITNSNSSASTGTAAVVDVDIKALEQFTKEIRIASTLEHDNVVRFVGLAWRTLPELCMVSEFMPGGDLARCLASEQGKLLTWGDHKVALAFDIANALVYLHSLQPVIIHRDLKSLNVLLTEQFNAKLSDFGLSRERDVEMTMTSGVGTLLWTAPEVLRGEKYSEKADIYSFGVVLSELDTCLPPYSLNEEAQAQGVRSKSLHLLPLITKGQITPKFRPDCPPAVLKLARACLRQDADARPRAMEIVYELRSKIWPSFL